MSWGGGDWPPALSFGPLTPPSLSPPALGTLPYGFRTTQAWALMILCGSWKESSGSRVLQGPSRETSLALAAQTASPKKRLPETMVSMTKSTSDQATFSLNTRENLIPGSIFKL